MGDKKYKGCLIVNKPCLNDEQVKNIKEKYKDQKDNIVSDKIAREIYDNLCDVCKIFGSNHFASKIYINDAYIVGDKAHIDTRDGVAIDRDKLIAADRKKYNFECVSAGTKFKFRMTFENLEDKQIEIAKLIVSLLKSGEIKVGGKTSAGLGDIELVEYSVYKVDKSNLIEYLKQESEEKRKQKVYKEEW
ncbi:MAG: CRISPR-associated protein [Caloramator sp.]|uniref:RAMP superfamily CRISPR-associated protein n=1 Tax=Caloramator sp. TaxID=1871330 RepID=UPI001D3BF3A9|nr:RAMP superfamily CRISPR-associated protein [Caloramator sp.]MBZ4663743.1 CRISPR-associated protein [Caloramator sp.]